MWKNSIFVFPCMYFLTTIWAQIKGKIFFPVYAENYLINIKEKKLSKMKLVLSFCACN